MSKFVAAISLLLTLQQCCQASTPPYRPPPPLPISSQHCHPDQSIALLQFKNSFFMYKHDDKMASWKEGSDCCLWEGVTCDPFTGHVVGLNLSCDLGDPKSSNMSYTTCRRFQGTLHPNNSLFHLRHLRNLDLSENYFNGSTIPSTFTQLISLTHLNLSWSSFSGHIPLGFSHLNKLVSLDLSYSGLEGGDSDGFSKLLLNATELSELRLSGVDMSNIKPSSFSNLSHSLTYVDLSNCGLIGSFPESVFRLPNVQEFILIYNPQLSVQFPFSNWTADHLQVLALSYANFSRQLMIPTSIGNLKSLDTLLLGDCSLSGSIPASIGNLTSLTYLNLDDNSLPGEFPDILPNLVQLENLSLRDNKLSGWFPGIFGNLSKKLTTLDISDNNFTGYIPSFLFNQLPKLQYLICPRNQLVGPLPSEGVNIDLNNIRYIDLSGNLLNGTIPSWILALPSLHFLDLGSNLLTGEIPAFQSSSLEEIYLDRNQLSGHIPNSIFKLVNVSEIILGSNKLSGNFFLDNIIMLKNLKHFNLSGNNISDNIPLNSTQSSSLRYLKLSSCNITSISTSFPEPFPSLQILDLSHNSLTSMTLLPPHMRELQFLDLSYNMIEGPISVPWSPHLIYLSVANNKLTGRMPYHICNLTTLDIINLSNNNLTGSIPECFVNLTKLSVLNLRMNNFHGSIPSIFGNLRSLRNLDLNGNKLGGSLSQSLAACNFLEVLDVGNNNINGVFPQWLSSLPELKVLILHSNRFHGPITAGSLAPMNSFPMLRILDISNNHFNGLLPASLFHKFPAITMLQEFEKVGVNLYYSIILLNYEYYSVVLTVKGQEMMLPRILTIFTTVDLSNNDFHGSIPESIGELKSLLLLNLSHNSFSGPIPSSLGNLTELESLDLSCNQLTGEIPPQLASLTWLERLNLSQNSLQGPIPQGNQIQTFDNTSYVGNEGLCGLPLSKECEADDDDDELDSELESES